MSEVVAGDVVSVVVKLDASPSALGAAFARELARENFARHEVEPVQPSGQPWREKAFERATALSAKGCGGRREIGGCEVGHRS